MSLEKREAVVPAPFVVAPSGQFEGSDGAWSTFILSAGTKAQQFHVTVSSLTSATYLQADNYCIIPDDTTALSASECAEHRGIANFQGGVSLGFQSNQSASWTQGSPGTLEIPTDLDDGKLSVLFGPNYNINATYGQDTVALSAQSSAASVSSENSNIALLNDQYDFTVGSLGLQPGNFTEGGPASQTFLQSLANSSQIPSLSWSYTAGASYQTTNGITGSLILGGYDELRVGGKNATFMMPVTRQTTLLEVQVNDLLMQQGSNITSLVTNSNSQVSPFPVILDPTLPYMYLPDSVCDSLISTLGLNYDSGDDLWYWNQTQSSAGFDSLTFNLVDTQNGNNKTSVELPFAAFNLTTSWPLFNGLGQVYNYFPIRRVPAGSNTFILGRAFFQHAYVITDYERSSFTVAQAAFPTTASISLVPIYNTTYAQSVSGNGTGTSGNGGGGERGGGGGGLSGGAIAGIVIGIVAALVLLGIVLFLWRKKRNHQKGIENSAEHAQIFDHTQEEKVGQQPNNRGRRDTYDSTFSGNTAISHEMDALAAVGGSHRPGHNRHISELSSDSERTTQNKIMTPPAIHELADTSYLSAPDHRARSNSPAVEAASREISPSPARELPSPLMSATSPATREPFSALSEGPESAGRPSPSVSPVITRQMSGTPTGVTSKFTEESRDMQP